MSSRSLAQCSIKMAACAAEFENQLRDASIEFVRACTYRSGEEQDTLYSLGRSKPGHIVTQAKAGESPHNMQLDGSPASDAVDYYPLVNGKLCGDTTDAELAIWEQMGKIAVECGLEWGGHWAAAKRDRPHFQLQGWKKT